jgi:uncharacterized protein DUF4347
MLERLRNLVFSRGSRRDGAPAPAKRLIVEELEPWILMSADAAPALAALDGGVTPDSEVYELLEQPIATRVELVFIDARVAADENVLADLAERAASGAQLEVVVIDSARDGLEQIDEALAGREDIAALHIVSHGDHGRLQLGVSVLDAAALEARGAELEGWRGALTSDADILLYGCDVGAGEGGLATTRLATPRAAATGCSRCKRAPSKPTSCSATHSSRAGMGLWRSRRARRRRPQRRRRKAH